MQGFKILIALCALVSLAAAKGGKFPLPKPQNKNICSNKDDGVFLPMAGSCSNYYICTNGKAQKMDCGRYYFNAKISACDLPERVHCANPDFSATSAPSKPDYEAEIVVPNPTLPPCFAVANGISLPVPGNQRQYYFCINNKAYLKDCGNLYFVAKYSACAVKPDGSDSSIIVTPPSSVVIPPQAPSNSYESDSLACVGKPDGVSLPVAGNSRQYHFCLNNKAFLKDCGYKMVFVTKYSACALASNESEDSIDSAEEIEQTDSNKELASQLCKNKAFGTRLHFPGHCSLYVICTFNAGFVKTCGWREFNTKTASCDLPQNVRCQSSNHQVTNKVPEIQPPTPKPSTSTLADRICLNKNDGVFIASPGVCGEFFFCLKNKGYRKSCGENRHFNPKSMICVDSKYSKCVDITIIKKSERAIIPRDDSSCINKESGTLLRTPTSCGKFIICDNGISREMDCPAGLYFNAENNVCDWPNNVQCDA